jgi:hypothetical protein
MGQMTSELSHGAFERSAAGIGLEFDDEAFMFAVRKDYIQGGVGPPIPLSRAALHSAHSDTRFLKVSLQDR